MRRFILVILVCCLPALATAATADPTGTSYEWIKTATSALNANLTSIGLRLFYVLTLVQFTITLIGAVGNGEIDLAVGKVAKGILWMLFCLYLMTNSVAYNFIANTVQYFLNNAISWTTSTSADFSSNGVIAAGLSGYSNTVMAIQKTVMATVPSSWSSILQGGAAVSLAAAIMASITLGVIFLTILFCTAYVALKVFMIKVETALILALLPFSLALLGLSALRDQGFAPFKSMLALIYRIIILGVVVGGMAKVGANLNTYANSEADPNIVQMALVAVFGYLLLAFIAFKADQIAAALASGSANLGSGDMVGAAIAGAAAGGAVVAAMQGALGAASGAGAASQSMGDFMKKLGGEGSISNASKSGTGAIQDPSPAPTRAMATIADSPGPSSSKSTSTSAAPQRNQAETASNVRSDQASGTSSKSAGTPEPSSQAPGTTSTVTQQDSQGTGGVHSSPSAVQAPGEPQPPLATSSQNSSPTNNIGDAPQRGNGTGLSHEPIATNDNSAAAPATIGGAPLRESGSGKPTDPANAPKREKTTADQLKQHLGKLAEQTQQERQATQVSINTHQHD